MKKKIHQLARSPEEKKGGLIELSIDDKGPYKVLSLLEKEYVSLSPVGKPTTVEVNTWQPNRHDIYQQLKEKAPKGAEAYILSSDKPIDATIGIHRGYCPVQYYKFNKRQNEFR